MDAHFFNLRQGGIPGEEQRKELIEKLLSTLDESQRLAVREDPSRPLLIIAGAGSGKTLTMASRIAFLLLIGVPPQNILGLCFSRQAAETLRERVASVLPHSMASLSHQLKLKTFHAFGLECLRRYGCIDLSTEVYDARRQRELAYAVVETHALCYKGVEAVASLIDFVNRAKTKKDMRAGAELDPSRQSAYLFRFYQTMLHDERQAVDFGDLEQLFLKSLRPHRQSETENSNGIGVPSDTNLGESSNNSCQATSTPSPLALQLQSQYTHLVVDEFQDLNEVQLECLALLAGEECRVTCVGDPNQCIYAWRGATTDSFERWRRRFPRAVTMKLETNYRSSAEIVKAVNTLSYVLQRSYKGSCGHSIKLVKCRNASEQLNLLPRVVDETVRERNPKLSYGDIAVLCRTHRTVRGVVSILKNERIPVQELRHGKPNSIAVVRALLSYLRLCVHPHSNVDVECVLREAPNHFAAASATKFIFSLQAEGLQKRRELHSKQGVGRVVGHAAYSHYTILQELVHNGFAHVHERLRTTKSQQKFLRTLIEATTIAHDALGRVYCDVEDVVRNVVTRAGFDEGNAASVKIRPANGRRCTSSATAAPTVAAVSISRMKRSRGAAYRDQIASPHLSDSVDMWEDMDDDDEVGVSILQLLVEACRTVKQQVAAERHAVTSAAIAEKGVGIVECCESHATGTVDGRNSSVSASGDVSGSSDNFGGAMSRPTCSSAVGAATAVDVKDDPYTILQRVIDEFLDLLPSDDFGPLKHPNVAVEQKPCAITVTTVHQAKGKEWPAVIIPCCYEGEFPIDSRSAEEKRVFYVAMSRAMEDLVFMTAERGQAAAARIQEGGYGLDDPEQVEDQQLQLTPYLQPIGHLLETVCMPGENVS
ncbi:UvrD REP helicase N terminal domain [Trypanosoma vivax]|nr:UvrD REP helicase N terminal domain [Trypanosoma vivax]